MFVSDAGKGAFLEMLFVRVKSDVLLPSSGDEMLCRLYYF